MVRARMLPPTTTIDCTRQLLHAHDHVQMPDCSCAHLLAPANWLQKRRIHGLGHQNSRILHRLLLLGN